MAEGEQSAPVDVNGIETLAPHSWFIPFPRAFPFLVCKHMEGFMSER